MGRAGEPRNPGWDDKTDEGGNWRQESRSVISAKVFTAASKSVVVVADWKGSDHRMVQWDFQVPGEKEWMWPWERNSQGVRSETVT